MALAYTRIKSRPDIREVVVDVTLDGSYSAGGYALDNKSLGVISTPEAVECSSYRHATATSSNVGVWDPVNNKLLIFEGNGATAPLVECAAGDITTSHKVRLTVKGDPII
jgi:hypothetical protein